jgi:hypothetical protein
MTASSASCGEGEAGFKARLNYTIVTISMSSFFLRILHGPFQNRAYVSRATTSSLQHLICSRASGLSSFSFFFAPQECAERAGDIGESAFACVVCFDDLFVHEFEAE